MDSDVLKFAQVMAVLVPTIVVLTAMGVIAHRVVESTNRRNQVPPAPRDDLNDERLRRLEVSVDAIAIEIERISEAQRFTTKLLTERTPTKPD